MLEDENKTTTTELTDEQGNKVVVTTKEKEEKVPVEEEEDKAVVIQQDDDDDTAGIVVIPPKNNKKRNGIIIGVVTGVVIVVLVLVLCLTLIRCDDETICEEGDDTCLVDEDLTDGGGVLEEPGESETTGDEGLEETTFSAYTLSIAIKYNGQNETVPDYANAYINGSYDNWDNQWDILTYNSESQEYEITFNSIAPGTYEYQLVLDYKESESTSYTYRVTQDGQNATFTVGEDDGDGYTNNVEITSLSALSEIIPSIESVKTNITIEFDIKLEGETDNENALNYASLRITGDFNGWSEWYECNTERNESYDYYAYTFSEIAPTTYSYCAVLYYTEEEYDGDPYDYKVNGDNASLTISDETLDGATVKVDLTATKTLSEILPERQYSFKDEDTTDYPVITVYDALNRYTYYSGDRVVIEGASVIGRHGKTITIQQTYSSTYYHVEVWCLSIPDDVKIGTKINVMGTVSVEYGRRIVLEDARVEYSASGSIGYAAKIRYIQNDPYTYFYYSGQIVKHQFRVLYEVKATSSNLTEDDNKVLEVPNLYRAFRVEYRNWYKGTSSYSTGTDRGYTYIVLYNDLTSETKTYYDYFFDGVKDSSSHQVGSTIFTASWKGVLPEEPITDEGYDYKPSDYHFFEAYAKYQYYYEDFYFNFDEFERSYITASTYTGYTSVMEGSNTDVSGVLSGLFNTGDEVTLTGVLMEQHGSTITIQEYSSSSDKGTGLCLEVELDKDEDTKLKTAYALLITVKGKVEVHESETLVDYTHTLTEATIDYAAQCTEDESGSYDIINHYSEGKTRTYYGTNSISAVTNNIYGEYSAAYMHGGIEVVYLPDSWEEGDDFWFIGRLRYKSGSITYVISEYIPVVIYKDEQEEEISFYKAMIEGISDDGSSVTLNKAAYREAEGSSKLTIGVGGPTIEAGYEGLAVGDILMSNFMHLHYYDASVEEAFTSLNEAYSFSDDRYLSIDFNTGTALTTYPW
ncbi:MAG: hypothetical protein LUD22_00025 [Coprobacillus sp.]|nr:hypothetical protein [Coprobacillus sp.]